MMRKLTAAALLYPVAALAQRYDVPAADTGATSAGPVFAGMVFMFTAWASLADGGPWHNATAGKPLLRGLCVFGPPALVWWLFG